jgi:aromatic-L-amino-acid/L-tryptophan decarboxylase
MTEPALGRQESLDPPDWDALRAQGHRMLDDIVDFLARLRDRPLWEPMPSSTRARFSASLPSAPSDLAAVHDAFLRDIMPFCGGNVHPGFMGWVQGGGTAAGMLAEMLAGGLNANCGGRDHAAIEVERQILRWSREIFGFPEPASGIFVTGTSMANFIGLLVARRAARGIEVRRHGLAGCKQLVAYTSTAAHGCVANSVDMAGIGLDGLRLVATDARHRIDLSALRSAIAADRRAGLQPFLIVGAAGTVDAGAIDDLDGLADLARDEGLWLHVDGALGALAVLAPDLAPLFTGIERADSLAFDFHKWAQVPYDSGFIMVRDGALHQSTFAAPAAYLRRETRGLAGGSPWPCDFGPDLSRGFRALKTWFTLKTYGVEQLGRIISQTCALAHYLESRVAAAPELELLAPAQLNIVCFGYRCAAPDRINGEIVIALQEGGLVAPSTTTICGRLAIRAAILNHRTERRDVDALVEGVLTQGARIAA